MLSPCDPARRPLTGALAAALLFAGASTAVGQATWWPASAGGNDHYYDVVAVPEGLTWVAADAAAQALGGQLASITSAAEGAFVAGLADHPELWVPQPFGGLGPWLGGRQAPGNRPADGWTWTDGETWDFTDWAVDEPNDQAGDEDRLQLIAFGALTGGEWNDQRWWDDRTLGYVVEYDTAPPFVDLGSALAGSDGEPRLVTEGVLVGDQPFSIDLRQGLPSGVANLVIGLSELALPFKGGVVVPSIDLVFTGLPVDADGRLDLDFVWPVGLPPGLRLWFQYWLPDPAGVKGWAASNGVVGTSL